MAITAIFFVSLKAQDRVNGATFQTRSPVLAEHGMVCTSHPLASQIGLDILKQGGFLSMEDLSAHHSQWVEPVSVNYRGYDVWELPPNGQGISALQLLNILENKDFSEVRWGSEEHLHLFTEAKKRVFEDRAKYYADMDMAEVPAEALLSKEYAGQKTSMS